MPPPGAPPSGDGINTATQASGHGGAEDDRLIDSLLKGGQELPSDFNFGDTVGKADNAVDYEDISDDDLPSEDEGEAQAHMLSKNDRDSLMDIDSNDILASIPTTNDVGMDYDDLFGPVEPSSDPMGPIDASVDAEIDRIVFKSEHIESAQDLFRNIDFGIPDVDVSSAIQDVSPEDLAKQYFPDFKPHSVLSLSSMFKPKPGTLQTTPAKVPKVCVPTKVSVEVAQDSTNLFTKTTNAVHKTADAPTKSGVIVLSPPAASEEDADAYPAHDNESTPMDPDLEMACVDWDNAIDSAFITPPASPVLGDSMNELDAFGDRALVKRRKLNSLEPRYLDTLSPTWLDEDAIVEGNLSKIAAKIVLDLNDPHLLIDIRQPGDIRKTKRIGGEFKRRVNRDLTQRYNISQDEAYDLLKENGQNKVRSTIGQLNIEHSLPALRHQSPYYKTKLSVKEARSFHRPTLHFHTDQVIKFDKIKYRKKKSYRGKDVQEILNTTKDLSLSDGANYILLEYSEEYPIVMSNFGMGSRLINYYRRKGPDDESRPKLDIGETHVLMSQDRSPFWNFGTVNPGDTVPTLYNKMVRAPIFKHSPKTTDFLVVRSTYDNASRYYLRTIPYLYAVGQLFPVTEVPGPHSRKVTTAAKNRLKMICYRVLKRKDERAISVKDISVHFPENNDMQNRQKMKEFMSFQKNSGLWEMKPSEGDTLPDEGTIRAMVKPEDLCLLEAMQVGVRHLQDQGCSKALEDEDDESKEASLENQLSPWISTKNFISATQGKAMLQLHGEGDPSGRGEAFSFVRTSMKGGFKDIGESIDEKMDKQRLKELGGHSYNVARQQKQYEEAISRIWQAQYKSLSSAEEPPEPDVEEAHEDDNQGEDPLEEGRTPRSEGTGWMNVDDDTSQFSRMSARTQSNKVLRIQRRVLNKQGQYEMKYEIVRDPKVVRQYMNRRRELDTEKIQIDSLVPTGNAEEDLHNKKRLMVELARLQRNRERRQARERQSGRVGAGDAMSPDGVSPAGSPMFAVSGGKQATTRRCANCNQTGHIRTNKKLCPKLNGQWAELGMSPPAVPGTPT